MKKLLTIFAFLGVMAFGASKANAQTQDSTQAATEQVAPAETATSDESAVAEEELSFHQGVKEKFIEGGPPFMWPILICLILGLAVAIERIITLNLVTKNTKGPVASIFTQGLMRSSEGIDMVEKSIVSHGGVEMARLERGLIWISLFISLGPMLGFFGTVIGMVGAFDAIEAAGDISPQVVAGGMKVALITTVGGLIVGMVLQVLYNYLVSKIDSLVNSMEDASISLIDILVKHKLSK